MTNDNYRLSEVKSLSLCDPMDCSLPGSSVHGIFQARTLQWVAISFSNYRLRIIIDDYIHMHMYTHIYMYFEFVG